MCDLDLSLISVRREQVLSNHHLADELMDMHKSEMTPTYIFERDTKELRPSINQSIKLINWFHNI